MISLNILINNKYLIKCNWNFYFVLVSLSKTNTINMETVVETIIIDNIIVLLRTDNNSNNSERSIKKPGISPIFSKTNGISKDGKLK